MSEELPPIPQALAKLDKRMTRIEELIKGDGTGLGLAAQTEMMWKSGPLLLATAAGILGTIAGAVLGAIAAAALR